MHNRSTLLGMRIINDLKKIYFRFDLGWYLYVSTASFTSHKKRAGLISEYLSGEKCISLAYCMRGKNMGRLDFALQKTGGQWHNFPFTKKGHQGTGWHDIEISLVNREYTKTSYRVIFFSDLSCCLNYA